MSPPGRPKGEYRSAQHEGTPVSPQGRHGPRRGPSGSLGENRSAPHEGTPVTMRTGPVEDEVPGPPRVLLVDDDEVLVLVMAGVAAMTIPGNAYRRWIDRFRKA